MTSVYLFGGSRTPFGNFGGALKDVSAMELGVIASKGAMERSNILPQDIDAVFVGNVIHTSKNASYLARHIALHANVPVQSPALSVNRLCGSGLQAIVSAAQSIILGEAQVALAVGAENMSQSPHVLRNTRFGTGLRAPEIDDMLWCTLTDEYAGCGMGITAENLSEKYEITRQAQDEFALQSQKKAAKAQRERRFEQEIHPVTITDKKGNPQVISEDEFIKGDTTLESLSRLKPAFKPNGTVTAGNASGINDGAAAVVLADESYVKRNPQVTPLARIVSWGIAGVEPSLMGIGPVPASQLALKRANLNLEDIDLFEINEAFAAQYLAVEKILGLNREKVNVNGGAIALGHPVGASGARIAYSLALELKNRGKKYGLAALCIGGGQGISMILEAV
ncbi:acetyl-CoA acetyltransferase [Collibacillus ludicampi]|uniref:acetyl-CoA C-acetyltransferase n=1 Tax=Collibacillus ludicampi TaxID=2771369 RepID=A0AAV4LKX3_9BACL|nr:acetyl-CoA C-acetyltransferase [Collibacillus ludicampi]GIM47997.1 acetyl-CoA acetyltransferase [Collibacillus ludicampi]